MSSRSRRRSRALRALPLLGALVLGSCQAVSRTHDIGMIPRSDFVKAIRPEREVLVFPPQVTLVEGGSEAEYQQFARDLALEIDAACLDVFISTASRTEKFDSMSGEIMKSILNNEFYAKDFDIGEMRFPKYVAFPELAVKVRDTSSTRSEREDGTWVWDKAGQVEITASLEVYNMSENVKVWAAGPEPIRAKDTFGSTSRMKIEDGRPDVDLDPLEDEAQRKVIGFLRDEIIGTGSNSAPYFLGESVTECSLFGMLGTKRGDMFSFEGHEGAEDAWQLLNQDRYAEARNKLAEVIEASGSAGTVLQARMHHNVAVCYLSEAAAGWKQLDAQQLNALVVGAARALDTASTVHKGFGPSLALRRRYKDVFAGIEPQPAGEQAAE